MADITWIDQGITFACDEIKNIQNLRKHRIALREASTIFFDHMAHLRYDRGHSEDEDRFCLTGRTADGRLLFVAFTQRGNDVRIISARRATKQEVKYYEFQGT